MGYFIHRFCLNALLGWVQSSINYREARHMVSFKMEKLSGV